MGLPVGQHLLNGHKPVTLVEHWESKPIFDNSLTSDLPAASCSFGGPQGTSIPVAGRSGATVMDFCPPLPTLRLPSTFHFADFKARYNSDANTAASASVGSVNTVRLRPANFFKCEASNSRCFAVSLLGATDSSISAASFSQLAARTLASAAFCSASAVRASTSAMICPDSCDVRTALSNSPAIPRISTIRDSRDSLRSSSLVRGSGVNSAMNLPRTQPMNTIAVEIYPNHSQQFSAAFTAPSSESVRVMLDHRKRGQRTLIVCLALVLCMLVMQVIKFVQECITDGNKKAK